MNVSRIEFRVVGRPAPQGSKRHVGNGVMVESSKHVKPWREDVRAAALDWRASHGNPALVAVPVKLEVTFLMNRPKARRNDVWHATAPDLSKLVRSTEDALTGVVLADDRFVADIAAAKVYVAADELPGAWVSILPLT